MNKARQLGERTTFADLDATLAAYFGVSMQEGAGFLRETE
jgi:phosphopentomutase